MNEINPERVKAILLGAEWIRPDPGSLELDGEGFSFSFTASGDVFTGPLNGLSAIRLEADN